jgi:hypothetical protein
MVCGVRCPEPPRGRIADGTYAPSAPWSGDAFVHADFTDATLTVDRTAGRVVIEYDRPDGAHVVERWSITDVGWPE